MLPYYSGESKVESIRQYISNSSTYECIFHISLTIGAGAFCRVGTRVNVKILVVDYNTCTKRVQKAK